VSHRAAAAALIACVAAFTVGGVHRAGAAGLDVTMATADASPVEVTAATAYSFFVNPDVQMPRATAGIAAGRSSATASPADPGDDLDALGGVAVPMVEQTAVDQLHQGAAGAPEPFKTVLNTAADTLSTVSTTTSPVSGLLDTPFEHVVTSYPDAQHPGTQTATFGPDPSFADPTGLLAAEGAAGTVSAGDGLAVAEAGAGIAVASPVGVRMGRVSAHAETHSSGGRVTSDAISEVDDVDLMAPAFPGLTLPALPLPAGAALLHLGAVRTVLHSERAGGAARAVSTSDVAVTGVTVLGAGATLDASGLHLLGADVALQPVVDALNTAIDAAVGAANAPIPPSTPFGAHPVVPLGHLLGPTVTSAAPHGADETRQQAAGLAITVAGTVLVSSQIPPSTSGPPQVVAEPALLTLTLASARTDAYGRTLPAIALPSLPQAGPGPVPLGVAGAVPTPAVPSTTPVLPQPAPPAAGSPASAPARGPLHAVERVATELAGAPVPPPAIITLATLAEGLMLAALIQRFRSTRRRPRPVLPGPEELV
jgi:hypothetical protein